MPAPWVLVLGLGVYLLQPEVLTVDAGRAKPLLRRTKYSVEVEARGRPITPGVVGVSCTALRLAAVSHTDVGRVAMLDAGMPCVEAMAASSSWKRTLARTAWCPRSQPSTVMPSTRETSVTLDPSATA